MMARNHRFLKALPLSLVLFCLLLGLAGPWLAQAGPTLPPRDPTPTSAPNDDDDDDGDSSGTPIGAYLELHVQGGRAGLWTVVQWQDSDGNWQNVEGWQGSLENSSRWWVAAKDFGRGPFRWQVSAGPGGAALKTSDLFYLPRTANEVVRVTVVIGS